MRSRFDGSLYLVTDRYLLQGGDLESLVLDAVKGGVTAVQLREKDCSTREFVDIGRRLKMILAPSSIPLIINDRVDIALAVDADGVHVGQSDMDCKDIRRLLGEEKVVGLSLESIDQLQEAAACDIDYLGVSPIFATATKTDAGPAWGLEGLAKLRSLTERKLIAIGGVHASNLTSVLKAGADGVAVVSEICAAVNPCTAALCLSKRIADYRSHRK